MGRRTPPHFHRPSHSAFHYRYHQAGGLLQQRGRLRQRRLRLPDLVGRALLHIGDDRARTSSLSWRVELGAQHRRQSAFAPPAASPDIAGNRHPCVGGVHFDSSRGCDRFRPMTLRLDARMPGGPLAEKWNRHRFEMKLVNPANKRKNTVIVVGSGLAGGGAAATMSELGYDVKCFCFQDSPRRAHSIAAQGGINAAKNYQNDGDSIYRLFYDTVKGGDFRAREANVYRLAQVSVNIIDQCVAQGVPFAREYGGTLANRSFGGAQVSRTFYARGQTGQQLLIGAYSALCRQIGAGHVKSHPRAEMLDLVVAGGRAKGLVVRDLVTGAVKSYAG